MEWSVRTPIGSPRLSQAGIEGFVGFERGFVGPNSPGRPVLLTAACE